MTQQVTYISTSEVARRFGVERSAVSRWITSGKIKPAITTPGGHHKFMPEAVDALVADLASGVASKVEQRSQVSA